MRARTALLTAFLALVGTVPAQGAIRVDSSREFNAAVEKIGNRAGTIVLERGRYGKLRVKSRSPRAQWLSIVAKPGAITRRVTLAGARRVRLVNLRVTNSGRDGADAILLVYRSSQVKIERLILYGKPGRRAYLRIYRSARVTVARPDVSRCGNRLTCVQMPLSHGTRIVGGVFYDCYGCDFVAVAQATRPLLAGNTFDRALPATGCPGDGTCWHQDLVQVSGGRDVRIVGNRFGDQANGAAQLYVSSHQPGGVDGLEIRNNVLLPTEPGVSPTGGIILGNPPRPWTTYPTRVVIAGNTILSGGPRGPQHKRWTGVANSLLVSEGYQAFPLEERPVVVNNVFGVVSHPELLCANAQAGYNHVANGAPCSELDSAGDPRVGPDGFPLPGSPLIGRAEPSWAAGVDIDGWPRDEEPDIGAFEWRDPR